MGLLLVIVFIFCQFGFSLFFCGSSLINQNSVHIIRVRRELDDEVTSSEQDDSLVIKGQQDIEASKNVQQYKHEEAIREYGVSEIKENQGIRNQQEYEGRKNDLENHDTKNNQVNEDSKIELTTLEIKEMPDSEYDNSERRNQEVIETQVDDIRDKQDNNNYKTASVEPREMTRKPESNYTNDVLENQEIRYIKVDSVTTEKHDYEYPKNAQENQDLWDKQVDNVTTGQEDNTYTKYSTGNQDRKDIQVYNVTTERHDYENTEDAQGNEDMNDNVTTEQHDYDNTKDAQGNHDIQDNVTAEQHDYENTEDAQGNEDMNDNVTTEQHDYENTEDAQGNQDMKENVTTEQHDKYTTNSDVYDEINYRLEYEENRSKKEDTERIVNGRSINITDMPSFVVVYRFLDEADASLCGGNLITLNHVLSAAHCMVDYLKGKRGKIVFKITKPNKLLLRIGSTYSHKGGYLVKAKKVCVHPDHENTRNGGLHQDLAVITLVKKVNLSMTVQVAKIHSYLDTDSVNKLEGKKCLIAGWGLTTAGRKPQGSSSEDLKQTEITLISPESCKYFYQDRFNEDINLCALDKDTDACQGDSGGGMFCDDKLLAVVSWGLGCATGHPGVYARVDNAGTFLTYATGSSLESSQASRLSCDKISLFLISYSFYPFSYLFLFLYLLDFRRNFLFRISN